MSFWLPCWCNNDGIVEVLIQENNKADLSVESISPANGIEQRWSREEKLGLLTSPRLCLSAWLVLQFPTSVLIQIQSKRVTSKEEQGKAWNIAGVRQVCSWGRRPWLQQSGLLVSPHPLSFFALNDWNQVIKKKNLPSCCLSISNGHLHLHWWNSELRVQGLRLFLPSHSILVAIVNQMTRSPKERKERQGSKNQQCATLSEITSFCDYLFIVYCDIRGSL